MLGMFDQTNDEHCKMSPLFDVILFDEHTYHAVWGDAFGGELAVAGGAVAAAVVVRALRMVHTPLAIALVCGRWRWENDGCERCV